MPNGTSVLQSLMVPLWCPCRGQHERLRRGSPDKQRQIQLPKVGNTDLILGRRIQIKSQFVLAMLVGITFLTTGCVPPAAVAGIMSFIVAFYVSVIIVLPLHNLPSPRGRPGGTGVRQRGRRLGALLAEWSCWMRSSVLCPGTPATIVFRSSSLACASRRCGGVGRRCKVLTAPSDCGPALAAFGQRTPGFSPYTWRRRAATLLTSYRRRRRLKSAASSCVL